MGPMKMAGAQSVCETHKLAYYTRWKPTTHTLTHTCIYFWLFKGDILFDSY